MILVISFRTHSFLLHKQLLSHAKKRNSHCLELQTQHRRDLLIMMHFFLRQKVFSLSFFRQNKQKIIREKKIKKPHNIPHINIRLPLSNMYIPQKIKIPEYVVLHKAYYIFLYNFSSGIMLYLITRTLLYSFKNIRI